MREQCSAPGITMSATGCHHIHRRSCCIQCPLPWRHCSSMLVSGPQSQLLVGCNCHAQFACTARHNTQQHERAG
jgi:hypothetical protein